METTAARDIVELRIAHFTFLLQQKLTPLLYEQLSHAIQLHLQALSSSDVTPFAPDLDASYDQINEHWKKIYANMATTATLFIGINELEQFLRFKLLEDYANESYEASDRILSLAESTAKQHLAGPINEDSTTSDELYEDHVVFPLEESKLDRDCVEKKLLAVAERKGRPGNDIQPLIDARNWGRLAVVLLSDREITIKLTQRSPTFAEVSQRILKGISRFERAYFKTLSSPSEFVLAPRGHQRRGFAWDILMMATLKRNTPDPGIETDDRDMLMGGDIAVTGVDLKKLH